MRCSVILLGALLGRNQRGVIGYPGGCVIGKRPIDLHLYALKSLGAIISEKNGKIHKNRQWILCINQNLHKNGKRDKIYTKTFKKEGR